MGKSGHLTIRIDLTNNETGTVNVNGTDRTIVTPLITAVGVIFGEDASNVTAEHGVIESAAKSNVAAFVNRDRLHCRTDRQACFRRTCPRWKIICRTA